MHSALWDTFGSIIPCLKITRRKRFYKIHYCTTKDVVVCLINLRALCSKRSTHFSIRVHLLVSVFVIGLFATWSWYYLVNSFFAGIC